MVSLCDNETGHANRKISEPSAVPHSLQVLMVTCEWPTRENPALSPFVKRQVEFLRAAGVAVDVFHFRGRMNPWNYGMAWLRVRRRLASRSYHLVHAQHGQSGLVAIPARVPLVTTFRGSDLLGVQRAGAATWTGWLLQRVSRFVARNSDAAIVVAAHLQEHLPANVPSFVVPSGIDTSFFHDRPRHEARRRLGMDKEEPIILFAGNPSDPAKRFDLANEAVNRLQQHMPARLVVAWNVSHDLMPTYMSACDVLVFTSASEGSPNVVKEALACNLPVVSVPVGDVAHILALADGCELVADASPSELAAALQRVLTRGARADGRRVVEALDENVMTQKVLDVYHSVLNRRHAGIG